MVTRQVCSLAVLEVVILILRYVYKENRLVKRIHRLFFLQRQAMLMGQGFTVKETRQSANGFSYKGTSYVVTASAV
jgi:hypothetical protein